MRRQDAQLLTSEHSGAHGINFARTLRNASVRGSNLRIGAKFNGMLPALLEELPFSTKTDIMIERCPNCKGTFFDAGEIKMAEKASAELESVEDRMKLVAQRFADMGFKTM